MTSTNSPKLDPLATADSQETLNSEIQDISTTYEQRVKADPKQEETQPRLNYPPYRSSLLRHPTKDL
ncbi:MAG: protocatechuate 3,4-dioxygenase subunit beta, partial [Yaniella sp.]|nr:protocatechuate 3,4-dioxygenase subunit beta [Yaniella sp.]